MRIGVTMRLGMSVMGAEGDLLEVDLTEFLSMLGRPWTPIANGLQDPVAHCQELSISHLLLSGGDDTPQDLSPTRMTRRDATEVALLDYAQLNSIPTMGICRGFQMMNLVTGGRCRSLAEENPQSGVDAKVFAHAGKMHDVITPDNRVYVTNSFHKYGVVETDLGEGFEILAKSRDGVVEVVRHREIPWFGMQFHPERPGGDNELGRRLIDDWLGAH